MISFIIAVFIMAFCAAFAVGVIAIAVRICVAICKFIGWIVLIAALPFLWLITGILWVTAKVVNKQVEEEPELIISVEDEPEMRDVTPRVRRLSR
jgi:hypothetical protein